MLSWHDTNLLVVVILVEVQLFTYSALFHTLFLSLSLSLSSCFLLAVSRVPGDCLVPRA